jgi:hypothetical protein
MQLFIEWLANTSRSNKSECDLSDNDVWELQREFLKQQFRPKNLKRFLPIVLDLVDYHHHYAAALLAPQQKAKTRLSGTKLLKTSFCLAPSSQLAHFNYEIQDILNAGAPDISWMYQRLSAIGSDVVIYPNNGYVCTESLDRAFFSILEQLDGLTTTGKILNDLGLTLDDTLDFLQFIQDEGIVVTS